MGRCGEFGRVAALGLALAGASGGAAPAGAAAAAGAAAPRADKVVVAKGERRLYLVRDGQVLASYRVALGPNPRGTKLRRGDGRTPEGAYRVAAFNPSSRFYRAIRVSYPNAQDLERARALGQPAGDDIMIHGLPPERRQFGAGHWRFDWTNGCIAVTDGEMDEIWRRVEVGTPIEIRP